MVGTNPHPMQIKKRSLLIVILAAGVLVLAAVLVTTEPLAHNAGRNGFQISIAGSVNRNISFTLNELRSTEQVTVRAELKCVDGTSFGTHNWTGVLLETLLDEVGISASAVKVGFHSSDGYSTDLTLEQAARDDVMIAFEKDGANLTEITRLVVPGMWGYKWISGVDSIVLYDFDFKGLWEKRGYADDATIGG